MSLRDHIQSLERNGKLVVIREPVSRKYEMAGLLKKLEPRPVLFERVKESRFRAAGNLFCGKGPFAEYFNIPPAQIIATMAGAIANPSRPAAWKAGVPPCQEVVDFQPDLDELPILFHCEGDGGN
jgi:UbiD family decarboxylase